MGAIETKTFRNGNHVAVDMPAEFGLEPGERFTVERSGGGFRIMPVIDPVEEKRKLTQLMETLRALRPVGEIQERDGIEFPDRPGLC